jgi:hypothetical protein
VPGGVSSLAAQLMLNGGNDQLLKHVSSSLATFSLLHVGFWTIRLGACKRSRDGPNHFSWSHRFSRA